MILEFDNHITYTNSKNMEEECLKCLPIFFIFFLLFPPTYEHFCIDYFFDFRVLIWGRQKCEKYENSTKMEISIFWEVCTDTRVGGVVTKHFLGRHIYQPYFQEKFQRKQTNLFFVPTSLKLTHIWVLAEISVILQPP